MPGIRRLTALGPQFTLAVSLHAARDPLRDVLVPLNRRWPVAEVVGAAREHAAATGRRVTYEATMIDGINDTEADAHGDGRAAPRRPRPRQPDPDEPGRPHAVVGLARCGDRAVRRRSSRTAGVTATIRRNRGQEIGAACGQLAAERAGEPAPAVVARRRARLVDESAHALRGERSRRAGAGRGRGVAMAGGRARVAVSILDADHSNMAYAIRRAEREGADRFHIDVMDGHFVPNLTFGPKMIKGIRPRTELPLDAHLMISDPLEFVDEFLDAGCDSITFHVEVDPAQIEPTLAQIRAAGRAAGLAVKPKTPLDAPSSRTASLLDIVLVMTVEPGFGGQSFMKDVAAEKILAAREYLSPQAGRRRGPRRRRRQPRDRPSSSAGSASTSSSSARCSGSRAATWAARSGSSGRSPTRATSTG